jgi:hypothetical protein
LWNHHEKAAFRKTGQKTAARAHASKVVEDKKKNHEWTMASGSNAN